MGWSLGYDSQLMRNLLKVRNYRSTLCKILTKRGENERKQNTMTQCQIFDCPRRKVDGSCELMEDKFSIRNRLKTVEDCTHRKFKIKMAEKKP